MLRKGVRHVAHDDAVGVGAEYLVPHVRGEAVVDAEHHDKGRNAQGDAQDGHDGDDVDEGLLAAGKQVASGDKEREAHVFSPVPARTPRLPDAGAGRE